MREPDVISLVVKQDMCTGCGICVAQCSSKTIVMDWNPLGFLNPKQVGECDAAGDCIQVCPFNPFPKPDVRTEDELAEIFLSESPNLDPKIGKYENLYVGYSSAHRETSSSGGIATYIFSQLFEKQIVDAIFVVESIDGFYQYRVLLKTEQVLKSSKTRYYPVTLSNVFEKISEIDGKIAIVGIACFIKAIRLAQNKNPILISKISFLIGIICGGLKSKFFTEYLASKVGFEEGEYKKPDYRIKNFESTAADYSFGGTSVSDNEVVKTIRMQAVGDMWGTGLFKNNACDFCEDVTTELADISVGDAWISPYLADGRGTSIIVTRTKLADVLIKEGIERNLLVIESLPKEQLLASQRGSFNHRHSGLKYRINERNSKKLLTPPKRERNLVSIGFEFRLVQKARMQVREKSLVVWKRTRNAVEFEKKMAGSLTILKGKTKIYHYIRLIKRKIWSRRV